MSGHSKWKNIMHKKEKTDAQRAKVFTKIGKEIAVAVRDGGPDPVSNGKLRDLIASAPEDGSGNVKEAYGIFVSGLDLRRKNGKTWLDSLM